MKLNAYNTNEHKGIGNHLLEEVEYQEIFSELHHPMDSRDAVIEADRCYYCYDAPCQTACPTGIDVPGFIRMISQNNEIGAANKILQENIMGGTCARACPVETLCENACVRNPEEDGPIKIGLLQRFATDQASAANKTFFTRASETGFFIAVIGGGPAGLSCAHRLASLGHNVVIYEAQDKLGGLNEYGLAAYKMVNDFAQQEVKSILSIGGISVKTGVRVGEDVQLAELQIQYDAVFVSAGLGGNRTLQLDNEDIHGVLNAVDYIHALRQADQLAELPVGSKVVVIGGGMTAIDIAVQIKRLGAAQVTIAYRRTQECMGASHEEQELALKEGVQIIFSATPTNLVTDSGTITEVRFQNTGTAQNTAFSMPVDMLFKAIGQTLVPIINATSDDEDADGLQMLHGKIIVDENRRTSLVNVWAGGDCILGGEDLAVTAVQDGKMAALAIHQALTQV